MRSPPPRGQNRERNNRSDRNDRNDRKGPDRGAAKFEKGRKPFRKDHKSKSAHFDVARKPAPKPSKVYESPLRARPSPALQASPKPIQAAQPAERPAGRPSNAAASEVWLYGYHAVAAALANQERRILRLLVTSEALDRLRADASVPQPALGRAHTVGRSDIDKVVGEQAVHQGIAMLTRSIEHHLEDVLAIAEARETCCVVMLDQVSDPHNVGAIIRSAAAFDASAVITLDRRAAAETGAMAKSASGALDRIAFVQITNLARAIEVLKEHNFWVVGLEADGEKTVSAIDLKGRVAFVLGTEGEGLRRLVRESCDEIARLPINAAAESLNVSNAAAVALYERRRQIETK